MFRNAVATVIGWRPLQAVLEILPGIGRLYRGSRRHHPFDRRHHVRTSGILKGEALRSGHPADRYTTAFASSQPSIVRAALAAAPGDPATHTFLDLGCGKGRACIVASEFPYARIVGIELSPRLARIARRNAAIIARRYPSRTPIEIIESDALAHAFPDGDLVIFLYHPFDHAGVRRLADRLPEAITELRRLVIVYYNPVHGAAFDRLPHLHRTFAGMLPYDDMEIGFGPDRADAVVIWQSCRDDDLSGGKATQAPIIVTIPFWRAEIGSRSDGPRHVPVAGSLS